MNEKSTKIILAVSAVLLLGHALVQLLPTLDPETNATNMRVGSVVLTLLCLINSTHLFGLQRSILFFLISAPLGWLAEKIGVETGLLFGQYHYTDVLGVEFLGVPIVVALVWYCGSYITFILAGLISDSAPITKSRSWGHSIWLAALAGMMMVAWDLGLDPYMVYEVKAWIMDEGGNYFGEPIHGFVGWFVTCFVIVMVYLAISRRLPDTTITDTRAGLFPIGAYLIFMLSLVAVGNPIDTRPIAFVAMGIPIMAALAGWWRWRNTI